MGRPLVALRRPTFRINGERFYTLCKIMRFKRNSTYWLLEDVPNSMALVTLNNEVVDANAFHLVWGRTSHSALKMANFSLHSSTGLWCVSTQLIGSMWIGERQAASS